MGVSYYSYLCGTVGAYPAWCGTAPGIDYDAVKAFTGGQATTGWPFVVYAGVECDLFGRDQYGPAARARLSGGEDRAVAKAFLGQQFFGVGLTPFNTNKPITDADTALVALATLEQYAAANYAGTPVLHMNRYTATLLSKFGAVLPDLNGVLTTVQGSLVANSAGYPDNFIFATGAVHVWRDSVTEVSVDNPMKNTAMGLAERTYVVTTDCLLAYAGTAPTSVPAPTLTTVSPANGPMAGNTTLTLTGTGYTPGEVSRVLIGGVSVPFTLTDATHISVKTPARNIAGAVDVVVEGTSGSATKAGGFTYNPPAATVSGVGPGSGPAAGGTDVTIFGTGFTGATGATFGGTAVTNFVVTDDTHATARTPAHAAGAVAVVVLSPYGNGTGANAYTYV
ncbi:MAG: IPT/TIG domain-containing protein [Acidimicrobiales bacterium]